MTIVIIVLILLAGFLLYSSAFDVKPDTVAVVTRMGVYHHMARPGPNFKIPGLERVFREISLQNRSTELAFLATTDDQANVHFTAILHYAVLDDAEETLKKVAFEFVDDQYFVQALVHSVEGTVKALVAIKLQAQVLALRREIVEEVKTHSVKTLKEWGYRLIDFQVNDIKFD